MMKFSVKTNPLNLQRGTIKHARVTYISVTPVKNWFVFEAISGDYYYIPFVAFDDHVLIFVIRWYAIKSRASTLHFQYIQPKNKRRFGTQIEKKYVGICFVFGCWCTFVQDDETKLRKRLYWKPTTGVDGTTYIGRISAVHLQKGII